MLHGLLKGESSFFCFFFCVCCRCERVREEIVANMIQESEGSPPHRGRGKVRDERESIQYRRKEEN